MTVSVAAVMRHCRNYFETGYLDGTFRITCNALFGADGARWVYISGSMQHNGVWQVQDGYLVGRSVEGLMDEEFDGRVWFLDPPDDFLELVKEMQVYEEKNPVTALVRERFGNYERQLDAAQMGKSWDVAFNASLIRYKRMFTEVR